ncbi:MAG: twin-arginine translocase TatA/TatE family subunit [Deltaproteobacteria bacterium]|nr:twin-arginine translocase TatA/TatE family subunit [Deltaproteobacteria bacterium]
MIGPPGGLEWLVIAGVIVLIFGAAKIPKLGKGLGEGIRNFKDGLKGEDKKELKDKNDDSE